MTSLAWKHNVNTSIEEIAMLLSPNAYKVLSSIESITLRGVLVVTFNGNPLATIICSYSPANIIEEAEMEIF